MNAFWPGHSPAGQGDNDVDDQDDTQPHPYGQPHVLPPELPLKVSGGGLEGDGGGGEVLSLVHQQVQLLSPLHQLIYISDHYVFDLINFLSQRGNFVGIVLFRIVKLFHFFTDHQTEFCVETVGRGRLSSGSKFFVEL